jgi:hypothetical protein
MSVDYKLNSTQRSCKFTKLRKFSNSYALIFLTEISVYNYHNFQIESIVFITYFEFNSPEPLRNNTDIGQIPRSLLTQCSFMLSSRRYIFYTKKFQKLSMDPGFSMLIISASIVNRLLSHHSIEYSYFSWDRPEQQHMLLVSRRENNF